LLEKARLLVERGDLDDALKDIRACLRIDPRYVEALLLRAEVNLETGNPDDAWTDLEAARKLAPKDAQVYCLRAEVQEAIGDLKAALKEANLAVKMAPDDPYPYATRAGVLLYAGNAPEALADIEQAILLAPYEYSLLNSRAYIRYALDDTTGAMEDLAAYMEADTAAWDALLTRAFFHENSERLADAETDLRLAMRKRPTDVFIKISLSWILNRQERYGEVVALLEPVVEDSPELAFAFTNLGYARFRLGDNKAGLKDLNLAIKLDSGDPLAWYNRALVYLAMDKKDNACEDLMMAEALGFSQIYPQNIKEEVRKACAEKGK
jgi:tetratricopeptide (TPR) repeat protein